MMMLFDLLIYFSRWLRRKYEQSMEEKRQLRLEAKRLRRQQRRSIKRYQLQQDHLNQEQSYVSNVTNVSDRSSINTQSTFITQHQHQRQHQYDQDQQLNLYLESFNNFRNYQQ